MAEQAFSKYFENNCRLKKVCKLDLAKKQFKVGEEESSFYDIISDKCYERIFNQGITSPELVASVSCKKDYIDLPFF